MLFSLGMIIKQFLYPLKNQGKGYKKIVQKGTSTDEVFGLFFLPISVFRKKCNL
jgi:hypothetical protein